MHNYKPVFHVPEYQDEQIKLEHEYYNHLHEILGLLIAELSDYFDEDVVTATGVMGIYERFRTNHFWKIMRLNREYARQIYLLVNKTLGIEEHMFAPRGQVDHLATDMEIQCDNLLSTIKGRYLALIPVGFVGKGEELYTDETSKSEIIERSNKNIMNFIQASVTTGVVTLLTIASEKLGYTEYIADNQHDEKVRKLHREYFDGERWLRFDNPPPCGEVGTEKNCRCFIIALR